MPSAAAFFINPMVPNFFGGRPTIIMQAPIPRVAVASARSTRIFLAPLYRAPPSPPPRRRRPEPATTPVLRHRARDARTPFRWSPTRIFANQARSRAGRLLAARSLPLFVRSAVRSRSLTLSRSRSFSLPRSLPPHPFPVCHCTASNSTERPPARSLALRHSPSCLPTRATLPASHSPREKPCHPARARHKPTPK